MNFEAVRARWRALREELRRLGALVDGSKLCDEVLADLDAALTAAADEILSLKQAAAESGYSADYLARLIRAGKLPNAGRPHAPAIRRRDLPRKAARPLAAASPRSYDPDADARSLASQFQHGGSHGKAK